MILLRKMKQLTIYKLAFRTVMFFYEKNDLLYCYDISLENFTELTIFYIFPPSSRGILKRYWKQMITGPNPARSLGNLYSTYEPISKSHQIPIMFPGSYLELPCVQNIKNSAFV